MSIKTLSIRDRRKIESILSQLDLFGFEDYISSLAQDSGIEIIKDIARGDGAESLYSFVKRKSGKIHMDIYYNDNIAKLTISFPFLYENIYNNILDIYARKFLRKNDVSKFFINTKPEGIEYILYNIDIVFAQKLVSKYIPHYNDKIFTYEMYT